MKVDVLLGLQWGDEGKGKVVDVLTPNYDVVTRFQGGPNAGHTLEFNGEKYVLRSIPSGIFQGGKINVIGNGVVLDPLLFKQEAESLAASGHDITKQLYISKKAHLILPTHRILDAAYEAAKGSGKIGTTGKGIGPTYTDKISRNGVRVGDLLHNFEEKYAAAKAKHEAILRSLNYEYDITEMEAQWLEALNYLKQFKLIDSEHVIMRVADYIRFDLERDDLTFYTPAFKQMLDEAAEHCQNEGFMASRYFLAHPDPNISRLAANLISDKYQLSKYHTKFRELEQEEDKLDYLVPREIYSMKDAYILHKIKDIQAKIKEAQNKGDMELIFDLMKQNAHLNEIKNVLCKELGERIVLKM